jgi:hypothetical protein
VRKIVGEDSEQGDPQLDVSLRVAGMIHPSVSMHTESPVHKSMAVQDKDL